MQVRMIAKTTPVIDEIPDSAGVLSFCARVSSTANQGNFTTGGKLIRSLIRRKEWSPLEMVSVVFEVSTTRDIARQILRHKSFFFQEFSQRYAAVEDGFVIREARMQDPKDRQASIELEPVGDGVNMYTNPLEIQWRNAQDRVRAVVRDVYSWALTSGIAKEQARVVLPEGMTPSKLYIHGTLRSWVHYTGLRVDPKTQKEHRLVAEAIRGILVEEFPDLQEVLFPIPVKDKFIGVLKKWVSSTPDISQSIDEIAHDLEKETF